MAKWFLTQPAKNALKEIITNVVTFTGHAMSGVRLQEELFERLDLLAYFPESGKRRPEQNTREIIFRGYRIVYEIQHNGIAIITVIHSSRLYPRPTSGQF